MVDMNVIDMHVTSRTTRFVERRSDWGWIRRACVAVCVFGPVSVAFGQQFIQETSTRFPSPNPTEYTNQLTIGDIDGDGDLDIIFGNGGNFGSPGPPQKVRVFINNGAGFFTDETDARTGGHAGNYRGVELGDCDNDGDLDILLAQDFNKLPGLLINDGEGFFTSEGAERLPPITLASSRGQFGDIDNDGDLDVFFTSGTTSRFTCGQYRLYENDGSGFYTDITSTNFPIGSVCNNMDCIFGDINNDFSIDIRTASTGTNNSRLYRNTGTGVFVQINNIPGDSSCYSYDFADIDGDGDLDLLGVNAGPGSQEKLFKNNGFGSYTDASSQIPNNPSTDDNDSKFIDYDMDGDLDLLVGALGGSSERFYNNDGNGILTLTSGVISLQTDSTLDIMVADLTGNGKFDIVTGQGESGNFQNRIYINNGPADNIAPWIVKTEQLDDTKDDLGPYVVRANILDQMTSDRNFFDKGIFLNYTVDGGEEQTVLMKYSGGQVYRGELPGQPFGSQVAYWVTAFDFNDNMGTGETHEFEVLGDVAPVMIVSSDPPNNAIDARQPTVPGGGDLAGWDSIELTFDGDAQIVAPGDFTITVDPDDITVPAVASVEPDGDTLLLTFDSMIPRTHWTTITHVPSGTSTRIGYLPADVSNDRISNANDILELIDHLNGAIDPLAEYQTDVDRSEMTNANDILRTIDILNLGCGKIPGPPCGNGVSLPD
ncbi:MAG: VCBS repeat-containing protein [Planctomycetes bacterium]|nr:VCBS repeat-containing protein [Planctomycetota bacterium]